MPPKFFKKKWTKSSTKASDTKEPPTVNLNAKYLVIVESPSKCNKIEEYLGSEYQCIASKGHIRQIEGLKNIETKTTFEPTYTETPEKKRHIENMRQIIARFPKANVIIATDDDREGESIGYSICELFGLPAETTPRIIFQEITQPALQAAIRTPNVLNMSIVNAQKARQVLDIIVGFKISPYLWKYFSKTDAKVLSAGRCQTPTLRLIYDNENENKRKEINMSYKIKASFTAKQIVFDLHTPDFETPDNVLAFMEESREWQHKISVEEPKECKRGPPKPFNTSRLIQAAGNQLHMTTRETMERSQHLYQAGHITYMRTESSQYSPVFLDKMRTFIVETWGADTFVGNLHGLSNVEKKTPHEAIRITNIKTRNIHVEDHRTAALYRLIWKTTVESCMAEAKYRNSTVKITSPRDGHYNYTVEIPVFLGWKVAGGEAPHDTADINNGLLFYFKTLETTTKHVTWNWMESTMMASNRGGHYTEASLIQKLEELGIGRPSTFASIVDTNIERGYVKRRDIEGQKVYATEHRLEAGGKVSEKKTEKIFGAEKNKLCIEPIGITVLNFLLNYFGGFFSYEYTRNMEEQLDDVIMGRDWSEICRNCYKEIKQLSKPVNTVLKERYPLDEGKYYFTFGKYGPVIEKGGGGGGGSGGEEESKPEYITVKKDIEINVEKLKAGGYKFEELAEIKDDCIGVFEGEKVFLKSGRYGNYLECGETKKSLKALKKPLNEITWDDVEPILAETEPNTKGSFGGILRTLNENMSLRNGKFGCYVFYKTSGMTKPRFLNIKQFPDNYLICSSEKIVEWACKKYKITL